MMGWSATDWSEATVALGTVLGALGYLVRLYLRSGFVTKSDLQDHGKKLDELASRTDALEGRLCNIATKEDVGQVKVAIERADGDRRELAAKVDGIRDLLTRIEKPLDLINEFLLTGGAK